MPKDSLKKNVNTAILEPPKNFGGMIRYWGPGLVMTAGVVGSGELIATTGLGAQTGFIALWLIILSCVIKVVVHPTGTDPSSVEQESVENSEEDSAAANLVIEDEPPQDSQDEE